MSASEKKWKKIDFRQFVNEYGVDPIIENAPNILYSEKDKEHRDYNSLRAFILVNSGLFVYIYLSLLFIEIYFSIFVFITVISIAVAVDLIFIFYYFKSKVNIKATDCWVEIFNYLDFFCFSYNIIFSGKCHPNQAKSIIFKLYQDEVLNSTIDITQIEVYLKFNQKDSKKIENLGYFFEYGKGVPFNNEIIDHNSWQFFPFETSKNNNYISIANWAHQYEWWNDLEFDFNKLHEYAPWIIKRWNDSNLKPLTKEFKEKIKWTLRYINPNPKLKPWKGDLKKQTYEPQKAYWEKNIIDETIKNVIGEDYKVKTLKDLKFDLFELKAYFRELKP
ncbi:MAG: hypothetical protein ACFFAH_00580 [Promethearchaeota archaeon]